MDVVDARQFPPARLVYAEAVHECREFVAVLGVVNPLGLRAEHRHVLLVEARGEVLWYLPARREDHAVGCLQLDDVHDALECEFVEVEAVTHIVVGRDRLGVVVDHHRPPPVVAHGLQRVDAAPVKLDGRADAVGSRPEHDDRAVVVLVVDVAAHAVVGEVEVVGPCGILGRQRVDLLDHRHDARRLADGAHGQAVALVVGIHAFLEHGAGYLEVREALPLGPPEQLGRELVEAVEPLDVLGRVDDAAQLLQEPLVDLGQVVYLVDGVAPAHGL